MRTTNRPERRKIPRHGLAARVVLRDHRPPMHAMTRDFSLRGMQLMTATRRIKPDQPCTVEVEIDPRDRRWTPPLPVRIVWSDHTTAGLIFEHLSDQAAGMLRALIDETRARRRRPRYRHERG